MATTVKKKRMGRPSISAKARKGSNMTFRTRADLRAQLGKLAERGGRSLSEEIERRLEESISQRDIVLRAMGGKNAAETARPLLDFLSLLERRDLDWKQAESLTDVVAKMAGVVVAASVTGRPLSADQQISFYDLELAFTDPRNRVVSAAMVVMQLAGLAVTNPDDAYAAMVKQLMKAQPSGE